MTCQNLIGGAHSAQCQAVLKTTVLNVVAYIWHARNQVRF